MKNKNHNREKVLDLSQGKVLRKFLVRNFHFLQTKEKVNFLIIKNRALMIFKIYYPLIYPLKIKMIIS